MYFLFSLLSCLIYLYMYTYLLCVGAIERSLYFPFEIVFRYRDCIKIKSNLSYAVLYSVYIYEIVSLFCLYIKTIFDYIVLINGGINDGAMQLIRIISVPLLIVNFLIIYIIYILCCDKYY